MIETSGFEPVLWPSPALGQSGLYGVCIGIVTNNQDPAELGRVKVRFPWLSDEDESTWARILTPMAGPERGLYFLPEVDDEVLVAFEHGQVEFPYILGALWNGKDKPPASNAEGKNDVRIIKSRSGHVIKLDDSEGSEKIEIIAKDGAQKIVFDSANQNIQVTCDKGNVEVKASDGAVKVDATTVEITSTGDMTLKANGNMTITGAKVAIN